MHYQCHPNVPSTRKEFVRTTVETSSGESVPITERNAANP